MIPNMKTTQSTLSGGASVLASLGEDSRGGSRGRSPHRCAMLVVLMFVATLAHAATNDLSGLLQKGLFEEEANRNLDAASAAYETLVKQLDKDRQIGATAVFRLGEVYRKQGKTNEAAAQYERIVRDFAEQTTLVTLSRQNLAGLKPTPSANAPQSFAERVRQIQARQQAEYDNANDLARLKLLSPEELLQVLPTLAPDQLLEKLLEQRHTTQTKLAELRQDMGPDNPEIKRLTAVAKTIDEQIDQRVAGILKALELRQKTSPRSENIAKVDEALPRTGAVATIVDEEEAEIRRIQAMIQNSPDLINAASGDPSRTPLGQAAEKGRLRVAEYLLNNGADVNTSASGSPLAIAARNGHKKMVELLLARGAAVDAVDSERRTPLHVAVSRNYPAVMEALLAAKADPNAKDNNDNTPLMAAIRSGSLPMAQALLARGANPNIVNKVPSNTGFGSVGANERAVFGSALHFAAGRGSVPLTRLLLTNRADVTLRSTFGETALHVAAANGHTEAVALLIAAGADANARGSEALTGGATPLHLATSARAADVVKLLLENKADPNPTAIYGGAGVTPLMLAANNKDVELIALLLKYKADPNQTDANGVTALVNAVRTRDAETVEVLLAGGANPDTRLARQSDFSVLMLAVTDYVSKEVVAALIAAKADVNAADREGRTPLSWAASYNRKDLVELLVQAGADVNLRDKNGKTALDYTKPNLLPALPAQGVGRLVRPSETVSVSSGEAKPADIAALLRQHGALDKLPDFTRIRITRQGLAQPYPVFGKMKNVTNQFTLLETVMKFYNGAVYDPTTGQNHAAFQKLPFPDFGRIIIRRPNPKDTGREQEIKVNLLNGRGVVDCANDVAVLFGDVIEIPERVHALDAAAESPVEQVTDLLGESQIVAARIKQMVAEGLTKEHPSMIKASIQAAKIKPEVDAVACLRKTIQLVVVGNTTLLTVDSWNEGFLKESVAKSEARAALRSSSDLTRVQVKRKDVKSGKVMVLTVDATDANDSLWLQDGDVIEVPDKP